MYIYNIYIYIIDIYIYTVEPSNSACFTPCLTLRRFDSLRGLGVRFLRPV